MFLLSVNMSSIQLWTTFALTFFIGSLKAEHTCKPISDSVNEAPENLPLETILEDGIRFIDEQKAKVNFNKSNAIFILGNTGSGKTTLTQILAGNLSRLHATYTSGKTLVIVDDDNRIGAPSTKSRTLVPELVPLPNSNVIFIDCPGFDDTRGPKYDIAAMYYLNYVLGLVKSAKFLFVVPQSSVVLGSSRLDFDLFVTHIVKLFKNVNLLSNSFGLVVSKVNNYNSAGEALSDSDISKPIIEFLENYVGTLREKLKNSKILNSSNDNFENKISFVNEITQDFIPGKAKISFVRSPTSCGPLSEVDSVLDSKSKTTKLYATDLKYVNVNLTYFDITLKDNTELWILTEILPNLFRKMKSLVTHSFLCLEENAAENLHKQLADFMSTKTLNDELTNINSAFDRWYKQVTGIQFLSTREIQDLSVEIKATRNCTNRLLDSFINQAEFYLGIVKEHSSIQQLNSTWLQPSSQLGKNLDDLKSFSEFCNNVDSKLKTHSGRSVMTNPDISKTTINVNSVLQFLSDNNLAHVTTNFQNIWENFQGLEEKQYLVNLIQENIVRIECIPSTISGYRVIVFGKTVALSDFFSNGQIRWPLLCSHQTISEIFVLASHIVYFDTEFNAVGKNYHVSIIAPVWEIVKSSTINLDGVDGPVQNSGQAKSGTQFGENGQNGDDGANGGDAGSFFGLYEEVHTSDGNAISISAKGGNGANGQDGGNGYEGHPGKDVQQSDFPNAYKPAEGEFWWGKIDENTEEISHNLNPYGVYNQAWFSRWGYNGGRGGDGGSGGNGGMPGRSGNIQVDSINTNEIANERYIKPSSELGKPGLPGEAGKGGKGGKQGKHMTCGWYSFFGINPKYYGCYSINSWWHFESGKDGSKGEELEGESNTPVTYIQPKTVAANWLALFENTVNTEYPQFNGKLKKKY